MKKILIVLLLLALIIIGAAAMFVMTFDVNRYKNLIEEQLSSALGNTVKLGKLSLIWNGRIVMGVDGLDVLAQDKKVLSTGKIEADLELVPLFSRKLEIPHITIIKPDISLVRQKDGVIIAAGYSPKPPEAKPAKPKNDTPLPISPSIKSFEIVGGSVTFRDMMSQPEAIIALKQIDAKITDISMEGPVHFTGKAAFASTQQNLGLSGTAGGFVKGNIFLKDTTGTVDLGAIEHAALLKAIPSLASAGIEQGLAGKLKVTITDLSTVSGKIDRLLASAELNDGRIKVSSLKVPVEKAACSLTVDKQVLNVTNFSAEMANGTVQGGLKADNYMSSPNVTCKTTIKVDGLKKFLLTALGENQNVDGLFVMDFQGKASANTWAAIPDALGGGGTISLDKGIIVDTNVLSETLNTLTMFPMIKDKLYEMVPENVRREFGQNYTILKPITMKYTVKDRYIYMPDLKIETDFFDISGSGKSSFTGDISGEGTILFTKAISDGLVKIAPPLANMKDSGGRIGFPSAFKSGGGKFKIIPDLEYIIRKIVAVKAQELADDLLKQISKSTQSGSGAQPAAQGGTAAGTTAAPGSTASPTVSDYIGAFMKSAEQKK